MMKIIAYATRPDEMESMDRYAKELNFELKRVSEQFSKDTAHLAKGFDGVAILGNCSADRQGLEALKDLGITVMASRSAGINNIDVEAAKELGIHVSNVPAYSPNAVSEFAITAALCLARNIPMMLKRTAMHNYSLGGLLGFEMRKSTVGIIGTGRIGLEAAKGFKGLGARVIGYDPYPNDKAEGILTYVSLEELFKTSDIISLHVPLLESNYHLINKETLALMKPNAILVNTSRGGLVDADDVVEALLAGRLKGFAMDVYEQEVGLLHADRSLTLINDPTFLMLSAMENVMISPHSGFYTDEAVANMVEISFRNLHAYLQEGELLNEVTK